MKRLRCNPYQLRLIQIIFAAAVVSCRPITDPTSWCIQVNYLEGSPVDSAWVILLEESSHSNNWQDGYTLNPIGDTLPTNHLGSVCIPADCLEGKYHLHAGVYDDQTGDPSNHYEGIWELPQSEPAAILLPTPFWIRCIGGRNANDVSESRTLLMWDNTQQLSQSASHSFTPGGSMAPSALIKAYIHPSEPLPASRSWQAALSSSAGQITPLPSLHFTIDQSQLLDTTIVPQFW